MKGLTINIIASALAIKDEFFKRFAIYQVIRLFQRGNEPVLPRLNALLAVAWLGMIALTAAPFGVAAEQMEPNAVIRSQDPQPRGVQGTAGHLPPLGRAAPAADHRHRPRSSSLDLAAGRIPA